jgi:hypothetical protein
MLPPKTGGRADEHFDDDRSVYREPRRTGCYIEPMIPGPLIAEIAGIVGEPARATMLSARRSGHRNP